MNDYITLNGKKYKTLARSWGPTYEKPMTIRQTADGTVDATYGQAIMYGYEGEIRVYVAPDEGFGSPDDLFSALLTLGPVAFVDHAGNEWSVHVQGPFSRKSFMNTWDSPSNSFVVPVRLIKV